MTRYLLDTDILSLWQDGDPIVFRRVIARAFNGDQIATSIITVEESLSGWYSALRRAKTPVRVADVYRRLGEDVAFFSTVTVIPFDIAAISRYEALARLKISVRRNDLRIAAIALENSATVVTRNLRDFKRVPALSCENWSV